MKIYTPIGKVVRQDFAIAPRLKTLNGLVLGILDNNKWNAQHLLRQLDAELRKRFDLKDVLYRRKPFFSRPASIELIEEFVTGADVVITAVAD